MGCTTNWRPINKVQDLATVAAITDGVIINGEVAQTAQVLEDRLMLEKAAQRRMARMFLQQNAEMNYRAQGGIRLQNWARAMGAGPALVRQPGAIMARPGGVDVYNALGKF